MRIIFSGKQWEYRRPTTKKRPKGWDENTLEQGEWLTDLLDRESDSIYKSEGGLIGDRVAPELTFEKVTTPFECERMVKSKITQLVNELDTRTARKTEESLLATMKNLKDDQTLAFVRRA